MTRSLNKIMVIGRLGRDPELRFTPSGKSVCSFSVACDHTWKSADGESHTETEWFNVVAWGYLAEFSKDSLSKGSLVYVEGRLQTRTWQDQNGNQHKSTEIIASDLLFLEGKKDNKPLNLPETDEEYPF